MKKRFGHTISIMLLAILSLTAAAQSYSIRVKVNANIRAQPSLDGARQESVPAGTILEVLGEFNRWLRVNRGAEAWMASWVSHERVAAPAAPSAAAGANVDNCCQVDRQCDSDLDWMGGWHAYQSGQCQAPAAVTQASAPQPAASSQVSDNCCGIDRQCHSELDWIGGWHAYQNGQCGAPARGGQAAPGLVGYTALVSTHTGADNCCQIGWVCQAQHEWDYGYYIFQHNLCGTEPGKPPAHFFPPYAHHSRVRILELTPGFAAMVNNGWELLRVHAPHWYNYATNALTEIRERHCCGSGVQGATGIVNYHHGPFNENKPYVPRDDYTTAEFFVHEACHVYQARAGRGVAGPLGWINEYECEHYRRDAAELIGGGKSGFPGDGAFMDDPTNQAFWWW